jgi:AcrR family transcriptional regulator
MSRPKNLEIENAILAAACDELSAALPEKITMRHVAKKAGITATTIYYYYKSRDELFEAVKFRYIDEMSAYLSAGDPGGEYYTPRLRCLMRSFADWCFSNPGPARLVMARLPANLSPAPEDLPRYYRANIAAMTLLGPAVESGELHSDNPELDLAVGLGALWGTVQLALDRRFDPSLWGAENAVVDRTIELFLDGLAGDGKTAGKESK